MSVNCPLCDTDHMPFEPCDDSAKRRAVVLNEAETDIKNAFGAFAGIVFGGGKFLRDMAAEAEEEDRELERQEQEARRRRIPPERPTVPYACATCHDTKQVGNSPHEVPCPVCNARTHALSPKPHCPTCRDTGLVGAKGAEIKCPACKSTYIDVKEILP